MIRPVAVTVTQNNLMLLGRFSQDSFTLFETLALDAAKDGCAGRFRTTKDDCTARIDAAL